MKFFPTYYVMHPDGSYSIADPQPIACDCTTKVAPDGSKQTYCGSDQMMREIETIREQFMAADREKWYWRDRIDSLRARVRALTEGQ